MSWAPITQITLGLLVIFSEIELFFFSSGVFSIPFLEEITTPEMSTTDFNSITSEASNTGRTMPFKWPDQLIAVDIPIETPGT